jgi:hypothetical protein
MTVFISFNERNIYPKEKRKIYPLLRTGNAMKKVLGTGSAQVIAVSVMLSLLMSLAFSLSLFIRFFSHPYHYPCGIVSA